jgi:Na+/proline symporter
MTMSRKVERICGALTGVFAILAALRLVNVEVTRQILAVSLLYVLPAVLVVIGSWIHSGMRKKSGFLILLVGSLVLLLEWVPALLGSFYFYGLWGGLLVLTPGVMAAITIVAAWVSEKSK